MPDASSPPSRWSELYKLIVDLSAPGRALTKAADGTDVAQSLKAGNPLALIAEAEALGDGDAAHAVVARIRSDLLTVDLDGCADVIQPAVLDAAEIVNAPLVHLAASGSPDSVHMVFAPPTLSARTHLIGLIDEIRVWAGYDTRTVDVLTPARYLRLPGSASLKPAGDFCRPIDVDGVLLSAAAAAARARAALVSITPSTRHDVGDTTPAASERRLRPTNVGGDAATAARIVRTSSEDASPVVVTDVAPRAWRLRTRFSATDWRLLMSHPPVGARSDRATDAAWRLWQSGIRDWSMAHWYYRNCAVFAKFTTRDSTAPGSSRAHWESIATRARGHRPPLSSAEHGVIDRVREQLCSWTDRPAQAIAMLAILERRFTDGHGLTDRPIAVRDLMSWLNVASIGTAKKLLDDLVEQRALAVSTPYAQTAPREASRYSLLDPAGGLSRTYSEHDVTILGGSTAKLPLTHGEPLSPLWGLLGADCWRVYSHLLANPAPVASAVLASEVDLPVGNRRYGCLRLLDALVDAQLVERIDRGRRTKWVAIAGDAVRRAEEASGALVRLRALRTRINAERGAWHAETRAEHHRAKRVLRRILDGLRERAPKPQLELDFEVGAEFSAASVSTARPTGRTRRGRHRRPPGRPSERGSP
ncbi:MULTISPECIES: hypothetical protein [Rhodococcus]|uniref:hypothetical protein n=1 Tax=Rhodococcus TaxID=1827 RepID=UPI0007AE76CF|nr:MULTISPECIES: hypothetical protein [Rhodococcus]KZL30491.1 hypothetical protein A3852_23175 [Rhodococcus qingshengii]MCE4165043.1 hypothetical protein [Rhodococcus sp. Ni2]